jgi:hypothetical protein
MYLVHRVREITGLTVSSPTLPSPDNTTPSRQNAVAASIIRGTKSVLSFICDRTFSVSRASICYSIHKATCLFIVFSCTKETIKPNLDKLSFESNPKGSDRIRNFKSQNSSVMRNVKGQMTDCEFMRFEHLRQLANNERDNTR